MKPRSKLFDFELINVSKQITHGGSLRYVCGRKNIHEVNPNVSKIIDEEKKNNLDNITKLKEIWKNKYKDNKM